MAAHHTKKFALHGLVMHSRLCDDLGQISKAEPGRRAMLLHSGLATAQPSMHLMADLRARGINPIAARLSDITFEGQRLLVRGTEVETPHAVFVRGLGGDMGLPIITELEGRGVLVINPAAGIQAANSKSETARIAVASGLSHPTTFDISSLDDIRQAIDELGAPLVVKTSSGAGGRGVWLAESSADAVRLGRELLETDNPPLLIAQRFVPDTGSADIRAFVVRRPDGEPEVASAIFRQGPSSDFRANGPSGNTKTRVAPDGSDPLFPPSAVADAKRATDAFGLHVAGIDFAPRSNTIFEVNASAPGISELEAALPREDHALPRIADMLAHGPSNVS